MTTEEVNKIIAKYLGNDAIYNMKKCYRGSPTEDDAYGALLYPFHESLDSLVPVWEKLKEVMCLDPCEKSCVNMDYSGFYIDHGDFNAKAVTIQEAAAIATAKAIQELTDES